MNLKEVAGVLARIQLLDNRAVDRVVVAHWEPLIGHLEFDEAITAVEMHARESTAYLVPAHIIANVDRIRRARTGQGITDCEWHPGYPATDCSKCRGEDRAGREHATSENAPKPDNFNPMSAAYDRPVEFAREVAVYNNQLIAGGFRPVYDIPRSWTA